jgi:hypothetical protein
MTRFLVFVICFVAAGFAIADQPVPATTVIKEKLTKSQGDVYREVNAMLRGRIDKRLRTAWIDLKLVCLGDPKLIEAVIGGYQSVGWEVNYDVRLGSYLFGVRDE